MDTNTYCGVLKVIKAVVCENKPSPFPGFHSSPWNKRRQIMSERRGDVIAERLLLYYHYMANIFYNFMTTAALSVHTSWENKQRWKSQWRSRDKKGPEDLEEDRGQIEKERETDGVEEEIEREILLVTQRSQAPPCKRKQSDF